MATATTTNKARLVKKSVSTTSHEGVRVLFSDGQLGVRVAENALQHEVMKNGAVKRSYHFKLKESEAQEGMGFLVANSDGQAETATEVKVVFVSRTPEQLGAKRDAKKFRNFASDLRKRTGLNKGTKTKPVVVAAKDQLTLADLLAWQAGERKVDSYDYKALPGETQKKVAEIVEELGKGAKVKEATVTQKALAAALNRVYMAARDNQEEITTDEAVVRAEAIIRAERAALKAATGGAKK